MVVLTAIGRAGTLVAACKRVRPGKNRGPWKVLCDNESFLRAVPSMAAYRRKNIEFIKLPTKSPDFNPVEKMWGWARKKLFHFMMPWAFKILGFCNQKRRPYVFDNWAFHFMIPWAFKVLCFYNQNRRRRKVGFHFTIPRRFKVLGFYNRNPRRRKVGWFQRKKIYLFLISKLKTFHFTMTAVLIVKTQ